LLLMKKPANSKLISRRS